MHSASLKHITPDADEAIAALARVSNPDNQGNTETYPKLIRYLIDHKHWSPFEMVHATVEIVTTRDIGRQVLRHRSFSFQEFCVAGATTVSFETPSAVKKGQRRVFKRTIEKLYERQRRGLSLPSLVRVFDEETQTFVTAKLREVFQTGIKPTFRVTLENGKVIECTKDHKFLTRDGFLPLEDAVGLRLASSGRASMTRPNTFIACNGVPLHQNKEWMQKAKARAIASKRGIPMMAEEAGVSYHTIRKWITRHGLQFTPQEVVSYAKLWNRGVRGYKLGPLSAETIAKLRKKARRGAASNLWRGGSNRSERLKIADWCLANRSDFLRKFNYACNRCGSNHRLELHHIETVAERPDLAYEHSNIEVLCRKCHREHHNTNGDTKVWRKRSKGNTLTVCWSKVKYVEYVGDQMTYDLEVDHPSHNYVANGIVVHNSGRYAAYDDMELQRECRFQDTKNRQNSIKATDQQADTVAWWDQAVREVAELSYAYYEEALERGVAKEQARALLPEGLVPTRMYMAGSIRSFIHYCQERMADGVQKEHRIIAGQVFEAVFSQLPMVREALSSTNPRG